MKLGESVLPDDLSTPDSTKVPDGHPRMPNGRGLELRTLLL